MAKKSSNPKTTAGILSGIFIILLALIAEFFLGIDVLPEEDTGDTPGGTGGNQVIVDDGGVVSDTGQFTLFFTSPINTDNRAQHRGAAVEEAVIESINNAQTSIDAAFYELNLETVTQALIDARNRGVQVRLVVDDEAFVEEEEIAPDDSTLDMLQAAGFALYCEDVDLEPANYDMRCDDRSALMHHKFMIIDNSVIWMGSMNMTHNGVYNNNNNFIRITSSRLAQNYQFMFDEMFGGTFSIRGTDPYPVPFRRLNVSSIDLEQYFSPEDGDFLDGRIVELINAADSSIRVMVFGLTLESIGNAILNRYQAGVDVRGVFDTLGAFEGQMPVLGCAGAEVRRDGNPDILHHKVIIIDEEIVITGSFNFSNNAKRNSENTLIIHSPQLAAEYMREFDRRFAEGDPPSRAEMECR